MLTVLAVVLLSIVALLAIPVAVAFRASWPETSQNDVRLRWAFGLINIRIPASQRKSRPNKAKKPRKKPRHSQRSVQRRRNAVVSVARQKQVRRRLTRFASDLWRAIGREDVRLRVCIGLGDPADTGQLWAIMGPVAGILANVQGASIAMQPDFVDATFELDGSGSIQIIPLQLIFLTVALLLSPLVWRAIGQVRTQVNVDEEIAQP